jgi:Recombination endonuclease VII
VPYKDPEAAKARNKRYHEANKDKINAYSREWREENPDYASTYHKALAAEDSRYHMDNQRRFRYKMSPEEYDARAKAQDYKCALCGRPEHHVNYRTGKIQSLSVDHDAVTGKNRELLCGDCNRGIGLFRESIELFLKAIEYIKKHKD